MTGADKRVRVDWSALEAVAATPAITARADVADELSYARYDLQPGAEVPSHSHDNEEFGFIVAGSLDLWTDGQHDHIAAGESFIIARGVTHRAVAGSSGCDLLECYAPPRDPIAAQRQNSPRKTDS